MRATALSAGALLCGPAFARASEDGTLGHPRSGIPATAASRAQVRVALGKRRNPMQKLAQRNSARILDLLGERMTFERAGVRLYDQILTRMRASADERIQAMCETMEKHRAEEKEHEEWLGVQIRALGGNTEVMTEHSRLVEQESQGIEQVMRSDENIVHDFHALLSAELTDNAGWDLLKGLADELGDKDAKREFTRRLHEEEDHLLFVRKAMQMFALEELTGEPQKMPKGAGVIESLLK
jgi:rubrerythrin